MPPVIPHSPDKKALRRTLRAVRGGISASARRQAKFALVRLALRNRLLASGKCIGFYLPANAEIDITPLLKQAFDMGVRCFLPVVPSRHQRKLWFSEIKALPLLGHIQHPHWRNNRFGIHEYHPPVRNTRRATSLNRLFMPLLGFDARGNRVGMGGGFYDASLAYRALRTHWRTPELVGVAFAAQEVASLSPEAWDVALDAILTEKKLIRC